MTDPHPAIAELRRIVGDDGVVWQRDELLVYESDAFTIAAAPPLAAVLPRNTQQTSDSLKVLHRHGLPVVPRGSGTGLAGGAVPYAGGVVVATNRMTRIESVDLANRVAVVQAGVYNVALSNAMRDSGWHFSPDPSSQYVSTIGGNVAANAGGTNTIKYGATVSHVLGVELVLSDGKVTLSRAARLCDGIGADLPALVCGSEGTFGIVTRIWCRLIPRPKRFRTVYAVFDSIRDACHTVRDVIARGIVPAAMEMMDGPMLRALEEAYQIGFPTGAVAMLLIEIDGVDEVLDEQLEEILVICRANGAHDLQQCADPETRAQWWSVRKRAGGAVGRLSPSFCVQDACIPRSKLPEAMQQILDMADKAGVRIANVFHAGDGNVHPLLLFDKDDPEQVQRVLHLSRQILEYCVSIGGTITGEHGVGVEKLHLMPKMFNQQTLEAFLEIKKAFDPGQRVNDGKAVPSDKMRIELLKPVCPNVPGGAL